MEAYLNPALTILTRPGWAPSNDDVARLEGALAAAQGRRAARLRVDSLQPGAFPDQATADRFAEMLSEAIEAAGYPKPWVGAVGSAVTGNSFRTGEPFRPGSDIDVYVISPELLERARAKGIETRGSAARTIAISEPKDLDALGLPRSLIEELMRLADGRAVSIMIYRDMNVLLERNVRYTDLLKE